MNIAIFDQPHLTFQSWIWMGCVIIVTHGELALALVYKHSFEDVMQKMSWKLCRVHSKTPLVKSLF